MGEFGEKRGKLSISLTDDTIECIKRYASRNRITMSRSVSDIIWAAGIDENGEITAFTGVNSSENKEKTSDDKKSSSPAADEMTDILREQIEILREQLRTKDAQLAAKDQQMSEQLTAKDKQIEELHAQLEREQYIRANEQKALESSEMKKKRSLLDRLREFGKK